MNVALMGSVSSSLTVLEALLRNQVTVTGVLGVDEAIADRICDYRSLEPTARAAGVPFCAFRKVTESAVASFLRHHRPDLLFVIGLSQLVPADLLAIARHGGVGFHPTPLPRGRGRAPVAWTILRGEPAAATLFFLADEPDAGDIIAQRPVPVRPDDYSENLIERTNEILADLIAELAPAIRTGTLPRRPQDHRMATTYAKRTAADGRIDWQKSTDAIHRLVRAAGRPYHGAFTAHAGRKLILWRAHPETADVSTDAEPGTVLTVDPSAGLRVRTGDGVLIATDVRFEGADGPPLPGTLRSGDPLGTRQE